ncbi:MAG TPA: pitrilysin family protein [Stellaceae bacterium]|jgi:zinc protease|nr:pitrilysin family protein [Stellaceae bacterium]
MIAVPMRARLPLAFLAAFILLAAPARAVTIDRVVSPGGIEAWLVQDHSLPIITLELSFQGGAAADPAGKSGLAAMTTALLDEGAGELDSQAFQGREEDLASAVHFSAGHDYVTGGLATIRTNMTAAFELLRLALSEPRFDDDAVARIRSDLIAEVARRLDSPNAIAGRVWWRNAFPDHPYGRPTDGTASGLNAIEIADLRQFVRQRFARDVLKIGIVGDITPNELKPLLDKTFGALPDKAAPVPQRAVAPQNGGVLLLVKKAIPQSVAVFGEPGIKRDDPDWYVATIDNYIFGGGGFGSRLMTEIREKRGLAYGVNTYLVPQLQSGVIYGTVATQNGRVAESIALIRQEWQRMRDGGPSAQELADAKTYLTGSFALQFDSTGHIAGILLQLQQDNLGIDYLDRRNALIQGVTLDDAKRVARRLYDPAALAFAVVGSPAKLTPTREVTADGD